MRCLMTELRQICINLYLKSHLNQKIDLNKAQQEEK
jgi:hypothetical protein